MEWNYRIIKHDTADIPYFAVHEVYYSEKGEPESWTAEPIDITGDDKQEVLRTIKQLAEDCRQPVLAESKLLKKGGAKNG